MTAYVSYHHLGSWTTITDDQGVILQEMSFDAWGNLRAPGTWSGPYSGLILYDRGFTGHEHLFGYDLINMNGRMYDPVMSSFLSVDNYVQSPETSQSFNRYAYCLNNPLRYTDPSGELFVADDIVIAMAIGAAIGAANTAINNYINGVSWYSGIGCAAIIGAFSGAVGASVGCAVNSCLTFGGFFGGAISGAAGGFAGGFVNSFYTAGFSGYSIYESLLKGLTGAGIGALTGGLTGGLGRGIADHHNGYGFWDGCGNPAYFLVKDMPEAYDANSGFDLKRWPNNRNTYNSALNYYAKSEKGFLGFDPQLEMNTVLTTESSGIVEVNERGYLTTSYGEAYGCTIPYSGGNSKVCISPAVIDMIGTTKETFFATVLGHEYTHAYHNYVGLIGPSSIAPQEGPSELESLRFTRNYSYRYGIAKTQLSMYKLKLLENCTIPDSYIVPANYPFSTLNYPWP